MHEYETETIEPEAHNAAGEDRRKGLSSRTALRLRRLLGFLIALAMAYALFHILFRTDVLAPVLAYAEPVRDTIDWVRADPTRAWGALAVIAIPHIGLYYAIFPERR